MQRAVLGAHGEASHPLRFPVGPLTSKSADAIYVGPVVALDRRVAVRVFGVAYLALAAWCVLRVAQAYDARTGFTSLIWFGDRFAPTRLAVLGRIPVFTYESSDGFDGQFYAQIAVAGNPFAADVQRALDLPSYRARRILLPVAAHAVGLGHPRAVLTAYALANLACWLALAWLLARWWFPPGSAHDLLRWGGIMFSAGMLQSVSRSLTDGPALLLVVIGVRCLEVNRRWLAAGVLGAAGLVREASVLAAAALEPPWRAAGRPWGRTLALGAVCVAPALVWSAVLAARFATVETTSLGAPFVGFVTGLRHIQSTLQAAGPRAARHDIYVVLALLVQVGFLVVHRRPAQPWWRLGIAFALLMMITNRDPWADPFSTVPRAVLPLTVAFNVLVPRSRAGLALLVAGNLTVLSAPSALAIARGAPPTEAAGITCDYASGFHGAERLGPRQWRWASGPATLRVHNSRPEAVRAALELDLESVVDRTVTGQARGAQRVVPLRAHRAAHLRLEPLDSPAGDTTVTLTTDQPPWLEPGPDGRPLTFSVQYLRMTDSERR